VKNSNSVKNNSWSGVVLGEPASKANSRRLVSFGGKPRFIKSSKALSYSEAFKMQVPVLPELLDEDLFFSAKIYYASRRPDLDESLILDLLQERIYINDRQVKCRFVLHGIDKDNPRAEIFICSLEEFKAQFKDKLSVFWDDEHR